MNLPVRFMVSRRPTVDRGSWTCCSRPGTASTGAETSLATGGTTSARKPPGTTTNPVGTIATAGRA
ncbi:hypothetical protein [Streptomyces sp. NPDC059224]|uniref:hypothetical protein n=1 Tax=Streptomyces sp. NPDC059224 TaxID=3346775 RepID=UPI0036AA6A7B